LRSESAVELRKSELAVCYEAVPARLLSVESAEA